MIRSFEEAERWIEALTSPSEKIQFILNDIYEENVHDEECPHLNLFIGELYCSSTEPHFFIKNIQTVFGHVLSNNPYATSDTKSRQLSVIISNSLKDELIQRKVINGEKIIFICRLGRLNNFNELLTAQRINSFKDLGITDDENIVERIIETKFSKKDSKALIKYNWPHEFIEFHEKSKTVSTLIQEEKQKRLELDEVIQKLQEVGKDIESKKEELAQMEANLAELEEKHVAKMNDMDQEEKESEQQLQRIKQRLADFIEPIQVDDTEKSQVPLQANIGDIVAIFRDRLDYAYSEDLIMPFLMALGTDQIITLFGKPGTGKTTFVLKTAKALGARCTVIEVQNSWTERSDLLGYYNPLDKSFVSTPFIDALIEAKNDFDKNGMNSRLHIVCLDEMNLARIEYYFAEFLSKLQLDKMQRVIRLLPDTVQRTVQKECVEVATNKNTSEDQMALPIELCRYRNFRLPPNVRFIGTINHDDTTNSLSPKVIDRSFFLEITKESHSKDQKLEIPDEYFPTLFFDTESNNSDVFSPQELSESDKEAYKSENARFKKYTGQMYSMYRQLNPNGNEKEFFEWIIISKVLPAIHKSDEYKYSGFEKANRLFDERQDDITDYYDYLKG